jgi:hypothetical protein
LKTKVRYQLHLFEILLGGLKQKAKGGELKAESLRPKKEPSKHTAVTGASFML